MTIQQEIIVRPETISPETAPAVPLNRAGISMPGRANCTSTERQTNAGAISDASSIVDRLRGVSFDSEPGGKHEIGFIAEDLAEVRPGAVADDENRKGIVDYDRLIALLIEAVKEQQVQIKHHEYSIREQKTQVAKLRGEIERLKIALRAATVR